MGSALGEALMYLGKSAPGIGSAFDEARKTKEEQEQERIKLAASLKALADQSKADQYKQAQLEKTDADTLKGKTEAKSAYQSWIDAGKKSKVIQAEVMPEQSTDAVGPPSKRELGALNTNELIKGSDAFKFGEKTPIQQAEQFELPYHAANSKEVAGTVEQLNKDEANRIAEEKAKNPSGLGAGRTALYNLKWEKARAALVDMPEGPEKENAIFYMVSAPGTWYGLSDAGINSAAQKSSATAGASERARLAPDIQTGKIEQQARGGTAKVLNNQRQAADRLISSMDQSLTKYGSYERVPAWMYRDFAMDYAKLLLAGGQIGESAVDEVMQKTAKGEIVGAWNFLTGDTKTTASTDVLRLMHDRAKTLKTDLDIQYENQRTGKENPLPNPNVETAQTKVINGKTYKKVSGGWQAQ
jgi:hypothetical protein